MHECFIYLARSHPKANAANAQHSVKRSRPQEAVIIIFFFSIATVNFAREMLANSAIEQTADVGISDETGVFIKKQTRTRETLPHANGGRLPTSGTNYFLYANKLDYGVSVIAKTLREENILARTQLYHQTPSENHALFALNTDKT